MEVSTLGIRRDRCVSEPKICCVRIAIAGISVCDGSRDGQRPQIPPV
jgi:hypothetical protein